jgi:hypothetical protein
MSPTTWMICTLFLWIITFPVYLINRKKLIALAKEKPVKITTKGLIFGISILVLTFFAVVQSSSGVINFGSIDDFKDYPIMVDYGGYKQFIGKTLGEIIDDEGVTVKRVGNNVIIKENGKTTLVKCDPFDKVCTVDVVSLLMQNESGK